MKVVYGVRQYPLHVDTYFPSAKPEAKLDITCNEYVQQLNSAFYEGFITAMLDTQEEAEAVGPAERICFSALAADRSAALHGTNSTMLDDIERIINEKENQNG